MTKQLQFFGTIRGMIVIVLVLLGLTLGIGLIFQNNISRFLINPRTPFQMSEKPVPPAYAGSDAWIYHPAYRPWPDQNAINAAPQAPVFADVFYVHGLAQPFGDRWNGDSSDPSLEPVLSGIVLPNELGPFADQGALYAPHYRSAALYARFTHKYDGTAAYGLAFEDVDRAFKSYLETADPDRPLVLVGYRQGALFVSGLIKKYVASNPKLRRRVVGAYLIDQAIPRDLFAPPASTPANDAPGPLPLCQTPTDTACVMAYTSFHTGEVKAQSRARRRALAWFSSDGSALSLISREAPTLACVNPVAGRETPDRTAPGTHKGAASATGLAPGQTPTLIAKAFGAQCVDGLLIIERPEKAFLRAPRGFGRQWRNRAFNWFYSDLRTDVKRRRLLHAPILAEQVRQLEPIDGAIDFENSPINKVPD